MGAGGGGGGGGGGAAVAVVVAVVAAVAAAVVAVVLGVEEELTILDSAVRVELRIRKDTTTDMQPQFVRWRTLLLDNDSNILLKCVFEMGFPFSTKYRSSFHRGISSVPRGIFSQVPSTTSEILRKNNDSRCCAVANALSPGSDLLWNLPSRV